MVRLKEIYDRRVITISRRETMQHANNQLCYRFVRDTIIVCRDKYKM